MKVRFYLKRPASKTETVIFALINYDGNALKVYTKETILPKNWNKKTQIARNTPSFPEHPEFNERLNQIRSTINRVFLNYRNENNCKTPAPAVLKPLVEDALKGGSARVTFLGYFNDFVKRSFDGQRKNPRSKKPVSASSAKPYKTTYNLLVEFARGWTRKLDFETIDLEFHEDFTTWLQQAPRLQSSNTIGGHIQRIKAVLAEATERKINTNTSFKSKYFIKQTEEADTIYLSQDEIKAIHELDLTGKPRLESVRDLFLIACYTGLRFSDFSVLRPEHISDGFIKITQQKTDKPVIIPVHRVVSEILTKYNEQVPPAPTNQELNRCIKDVCKDVELLKRPVHKSITKGGVKVSTASHKWELVSTHTARRSFATNEYLAGTPTITIMAITGHKTEKSFLKYIRVTPDEHAQKIKQLWAARDNQLKAV
jgi:Phage integrase family.